MNPKRRAVHDAVLSYLTMTGVAVSATCLFMVVMTYVLFKKWRKGVGRKVLFNLCLSLLGALASFFALVALPKHRANPISCTCVGAALHYFILVSFAWTFVESLLQYLRFVRVLGTYVPKLVLKAAFGAWGIPLLVMLSVLILNPTQYRMRKGICWMDNEALLYTFLLPVGLILTANVVVFSVVVFSIYCRRQKGLRSTQSQVALAKAQLRAVVSIVFLLGLTWIFAYLSLLEEVSSEWGLLFEYLFVVTSSFQGLVIFLFHVAYEKTAREFWLEQIVYRIWPYSRNESSNQGSSNITL
ncbi:adhesion G-protein coupled receptor G6-like [Haemaphysalis longicornis]